jgi:hypothetical protein
MFFSIGTADDQHETNDEHSTQKSQKKENLNCIHHFLRAKKNITRKASSFLASKTTGYLYYTSKINPKGAFDDECTLLFFP